MKATLKPDFILHNIAKEKVLLGAGEQVDFSQMLILNDTSACIIAELQKKPSTSEELVQRLLEEYNVSPQETHSDVKELLFQLEKQGVIILEF